ncbi:hypothetical protein CPLU01_06549 [Colletotrichum plurivorum]|uniref:Ankyrin repeat protein n=1 Tax=Colletotrichum plurivorum TaxID=2175906 RepID=A0A8H6KHQ1_9PEZI|nr:hypothetical protein CPLU01_06549 [Colletotrichum plurivorum]
MASPQLLSPSFQAGLRDLPVELIQLIASYLPADAQETYVEVHEASSSNEAQNQSISGSSLDSAGSVNTEAEGKNPRTQGQDTICDLKNLIITCKGFYEILKPVLYAQGKHNDWHALRWGSFHGVLQTMADAVAAGAPIDHVYADNPADYHDSSYCRCFLPSPDTQLPHVSHCCTLFHEKKPVRSADTPLLTAIRGGQLEAVDWLLSKGADPSKVTPSISEYDSCLTCHRPRDPLRADSCPGGCGITPLQGALDYFTHSNFSGSLVKSDRERVHFLKSLVKHGADVNQQFGYISCFSSNTHLSSLPSQHRNPLGLAVFTQTVGPLAVKSLLDNGASFEMGTGSLLMPILAHMSRCRIPDLCWKVPVSIPLYGCETKASLLLSTHQPHKDCSCIPSYDSLNQDGEIDPGVCYYAWDDSHLPYGGPEISKVFRFLREHGLPIVRSDLDEIYSNVIPPLIRATRSSNPEAVRLLIEEGEDPNARCPLELCGHFPLGFRIGFRQGLGGRTALAYACSEVRKNQPQVIRQLLEGGADPMGRTAAGLTPMQSLSRSLPERGTVQVLLDFKAKPSTMGL